MEMDVENSPNCQTQELKIDFGPGYRVYFGQDGDRVMVLLIGGEKRPQSADIKRADLGRESLWEATRAGRL